MNIFGQEGESNLLKMIPENKIAGVLKAVKTAFGTEQFSTPVPLLKGLSSAQLYKIVVKDTACVLRIITRTDEMANPSNYLEPMTLAAAQSLCPPLYYFSEEDRILLTGYIEAHPFARIRALKEMPLLIRKLHDLPKFKGRLNYFNAMEGFMKRFLQTHMLPEETTREVVEIYQRIASVYPTQKALEWVSSHNDLKVENIIFDGIRPWIVDWESAFLNDPYLDLAVFGNFVIYNDLEESEYLSGYFGSRPTPYQSARYFLLGQMLHVYYFTFLMLAGFEGKPVSPPLMGKLDFYSFHNRIWQGDIRIEAPEIKRQYGWVHLQEFLRKCATPRHAVSLAILASGS